MAWERTHMRMERAIRMELAGLPDSEIAKRTGLTQPGLATMKQRIDYIELRDQIKDGLVTELDSEMSESIKDLKARVAAHVPMALTNLFNLAQQTKDEKLRRQVSMDIIELNGELVAPTKLEIAGKITKNDDDAVREILALNPAHVPTGAIN